jgi:hypothetical protein
MVRTGIFFTLHSSVITRLELMVRTGIFFTSHSSVF